MNQLPVALRRRGPRELALLAAFIVATSAACGGEAPSRPNLVLITIDRLATDRLPCFEGESDPGDSLCAIAAGGTLFAWTAASGHGEAAAAASVLTGRSAASHGVRDDGRSFLVDAQTTLAEELEGAGYTTAAFVASPRVNRSRRLDQGFTLYDDRFASVSRSPDSASGEIAARIRDWIETAPSPWFVWIHADRDAGLVEFDRLLSRLADPLERAPRRPGVLFVALRGERAAGAGPGVGPSVESQATIDWRTHRVPLIWRPPDSEAPPPPAVSLRLASLVDVAKTLRAAAQILPRVRAGDSPAIEAGQARNLTRLARSAPGGDRPEASLNTSRDAAPDAGPDPTSEVSSIARRDLDQNVDRDDPEERFVLLFGGDRLVGLASESYLYVRERSPLDGTGRPVPTESLAGRAARFSALPMPDPLFEGSLHTARLRPGPWRTDILSAESPVPRLEFHLAHSLDRSSEASPE